MACTGMTSGHSRRASRTIVPVLMPKRLGRVAGGDGDGAIRQRLHDDDGLAAQGRGLLLLARRKERIEIEEQPLDGRLGIVHLLFYTANDRNFASAPSRSRRSPWRGTTENKGRVPARYGVGGDRHDGGNPAPGKTAPSKRGVMTVTPRLALFDTATRSPIPGWPSSAGADLSPSFPSLPCSRSRS